MLAVAAFAPRDAAGLEREVGTQICSTRGVSSNCDICNFGSYPEPPNRLLMRLTQYIVVVWFLHVQQVHYRPY